jgi:homospermidine synthase
LIPGRRMALPDGGLLAPVTPGAVERCTLPIFVKHVSIDPKRITISECDPNEAALKPWIEQGVNLSKIVLRNRSVVPRS